VKQVILYSTLNPFPHWAGSENLWYDLVLNIENIKDLHFQVCLADSPVTRQKAKLLGMSGVSTSFYIHHNDSIIRRNLFRIKDKILGKKQRSYPWFDLIGKEKADLVFFNVAALADLAELTYAVDLCMKNNIPYWLLLQHGYEDFFLSSAEEIERVKKVVHNAKRFIFISYRNRASLERAIGENLQNAFHSVNAISAEKLRKAKEQDDLYPLGAGTRARFFNLGRFSPRDKAQHKLLEVFSGKQWEYRDWQLSFIGVSGFGRESLETMIKYYKLDPNRICIIPHIENVLEEIVRHDMLLMPSLSEGTPFAMVESMACGRPAVGTPVGGIPEIILDGQTGWLSSSTDVAAFAEKVDQCWKEKDMWQEYGRNARELVNKEYNQDNTFATLIQLLESDAK